MAREVRRVRRVPSMNSSKPSTESYEDDGLGYEDDTDAYADDSGGYEDYDEGYEDAFDGYKDVSSGYEDEVDSYEDSSDDYEEEEVDYEPKPPRRAHYRGRSTSEYQEPQEERRKGTRPKKEKPKREKSGGKEKKPRGKEKPDKSKDKKKHDKSSSSKKVVSLTASEKEKKVDLAGFHIPTKPLIVAGVIFLLILLLIARGLLFGKAEGFASVLSKNQNHVIGHYRYTFDVVSATADESKSGILSDGASEDGLESKEEILSQGSTRGTVSQDWTDASGVVTDSESTKLMPNMSIIVEGYTESTEPLTGRGTIRANFTKNASKMFDLTDYKIVEGDLYFNGKSLKENLTATGVSFPVSLADTLPNVSGYVKVGSATKVREFLTNKNVLELGSKEFLESLNGKGNAVSRVLSSYLETLEKSDPSIFNTENDSKYLIINSNTNANALGYMQLLVGKLPSLIENYTTMVGSSELKTDAKAEAQQAKALNAGVKVLSDYFTNITADDLKARGFVAQFRVRSNNTDESKGFDSTSEVTWKDLDDDSVHRVTFSTEFFDNDLPDAEDVLEAPKGEITDWEKYYKGKTKDFATVFGDYFKKFAEQSLQ